MGSRRQLRATIDTLKVERRNAVPDTDEHVEFGRGATLESHDPTALGKDGRWGNQGTGPMNAIGGDGRGVGRGRAREQYRPKPAGPLGPVGATEKE